jgi:hypothetical protein
MIGKFWLAVLLGLTLTGCPFEEKRECEKIMECQDEYESYCDPVPDERCRDCYYFVVEHCWEKCKDE